MSFDEIHRLLQLTLGQDAKASVFASQSGKICIHCCFERMKVRFLLTKAFDIQIFYTDLQSISPQERVVRNYVYELVCRFERAGVVGGLLAAVSLIYYSQAVFDCAEMVVVEEISLKQREYFDSFNRITEYNPQAAVDTAGFSNQTFRRQLAKQLSLSLASKQALYYQQQRGALKELIQLIADHRDNRFLQQYERVQEVLTSPNFQVIRALKIIDQQYYYVQIYQNVDYQNAQKTLSLLQQKNINNVQVLLYYWEEEEQIYIQFQDIQDKYISLRDLQEKRRIQSISAQEILQISQRVFDFCEELTKLRIFIPLNDENLFVNDQLEVFFCNINFLTQVTQKHMRKCFRTLLEQLSQHDQQLQYQIIRAFDNNNCVLCQQKTIQDNIIKLLTSTIVNQVKQLNNRSKQQFKIVSTLQDDIETYLGILRKLQIVRYPELNIAIQHSLGECNIYYMGQPLFLKRLYMDSREVPSGQCWKFQTSVYQYYIFQTEQRCITLAQKLADYLEKHYKQDKPIATQQHNLVHISICQDAIVKIYACYKKLVIQIPQTSNTDQAARSAFWQSRVSLKPIPHRKITPERIDQLSTQLDYYFAGLHDMDKCSKQITDVMRQFKEYIQENIKSQSKRVLLLDKHGVIDTPNRQGVQFRPIQEVIKQEGCHNIFQLNVGRIVNKMQCSVAVFANQPGEEIDYLYSYGLPQYFVLYSCNEFTYGRIFSTQLHANEQIQENDLIDLYSLSIDQTYSSSQSREKYQCLRCESIRFFIYSHIEYLQNSGYNVMVTSFYNEMGCQYMLVQADVNADKRQRRCQRASRSARKSSTDE